MKYSNQDPAKTIREQLFFTIMSTTRQVLSSPLLGFIYLSVWKMGFTFQVSKVVQGSLSIRAARKAIIWLHAHHFRYLKVTWSKLWTWMSLEPRGMYQRPAKFPSARDHIHAAPTLEHAKHA